MFGGLLTVKVSGNVCKFLDYRIINWTPVDLFKSV